MRFSHPIKLFLGLASVISALALHRERTTQEIDALKLQKFEISNIYTHALKSPETTYNRAISCTPQPLLPSTPPILTNISVHFLDQNSKTSSICTSYWSQSNKTDNFPSTFTACDYNGNEEVFGWYFSSFTSLKEFSIDFMHEWNDPKYVFIFDNLVPQTY